MRGILTACHPRDGTVKSLGLPDCGQNLKALRQHAQHFEIVFENLSYKTHMTNQEIESKLKSLTQNERKLTRQIVELIKICLERKLWVVRVFDSPAKWLIATYGYSELPAYRRFDAARALIQVPDLADK